VEAATREGAGMEQGPMLRDCRRILVTGAGGLLGKALVTELASRAPAAELLTPTRSELDLTLRDAVSRYWASKQPDAVLHLAAYVLGLGGNLAAGAKAFSANADINHNVLMACLATRPRILFAAGTVASYRYPYDRLPLVEEDAFLDEPHSGEYFYGLAKRAAWPYLQAFSKAGSVSATMGLFTNLYGPGDNFDESSGHVVPSLVKRFVDTQRSGAAEVLVWGRADTTRDFLFVRDAAKGVLAAVDGHLPLCNISSGRETTMSQLVDAIVAATGYCGSVFWDDTKPTGIPRRWVDNSRLLDVAADFRFTPLEVGVAETVAWYRSESSQLKNP
jgi:GDP-L-fucose synthase